MAVTEHSGASLQDTETNRSTAGRSALEKLEGPVGHDAGVWVRRWNKEIKTLYNKQVVMMLKIGFFKNFCQNALHNSDTNV